MASFSASVASTNSSRFQEYFHGRNVLVTGAGKGIGRALALELHSLGAKVFAVSRTKADLTALEAECSGIQTIPLDLQDWTKTEETLNTRLPGAMDVVINNAGISGFQTFLSITENDFDQTFGINVKALVNVSQICAKKMMEESKGGDIVNISAISAHRAFSEDPLYCASKSGVDMMTKCMAIDLAKHNIRVNSVNLGFVNTNCDEDEVVAMEKAYGDRVPMKKLWIPMEEVVRGILFVASGSMSMLTGSGLTLDGGFLAT